jgi:hypothetical protein
MLGVHSIISSARASSDGGNMSPIDFACLEIDGQLKLGGLYDRQVRPLGAAKKCFQLLRGQRWPRRCAAETATRTRLRFHPSCFNALG